MDTNTLILVLGLLFLGIVVLFAVLFSYKVQKTQKKEVEEEFETTEKSKVEFMKLLMLMVLSMWVIGGFSGLFVAIFHDHSYLDRILDYIQSPVNISLGAYAVKSGAENCKKISLSTEKEIERSDDFAGD